MTEIIIALISAINTLGVALLAVFQQRDRRERRNNGHGMSQEERDLLVAIETKVEGIQADLQEERQERREELREERERRHELERRFNQYISNYR